MPSQTLTALLDDACVRFGDTPAIVRDGAPDLTYRALHELSARYANALAARGVRPGDRVMVQVEKSVEAVALYLATVRTGAVFNPLNTAYTAAELDYFMSDAEPALVVVDPKSREAAEGLAARHGIAAVETLGADHGGSLADLASGQAQTFESVARDASDLAALLYTSGTTGRSKGAMITQGNLASNAATLIDLWQFSETDRLLHALPIFHVHGLFVALNVALASGTTLIWFDKFDADRVLDAMPRATALMGVPTFYTRMLASDRLSRDAAQSMRLFISGSAPLLAETHDAFAERTGHRILERYGMTEAGMITSNPYDGDRVAGTVGYALPGVDVRIAGEDGKPVLAGDVGVLEVKGPNVFSGYWRNPEKTADEFRPDGAFISGDLATMADDGRVTIVGRAKDLIISGGYNVYPKEIEVALNDLDGVAESAVIGVPHADFGEAVVAVITPTGAAAPTEADMLAALGGQLARFKLPKRVIAVAELPRNTMGKVQKNVLRETYADVLSRS